MSRPLSTRTLEQLARVARERTWADGEVLLRAGDVARWVILLDEGKLRISHVRRSGVEDLRKGTRAGGTLGLTSVVSGRPFPFSVAAEGVCKTRLVAAGDVLALMGSDVELALDFARVLAHFARDLEDASLEEREESLIDRLHAALLRLRRLGTGLPVKGGFAVRVSQYDLACMVGTSRQYINPQLQRLQDQGVVRLGYRTIVLLDDA